jgi:hypothetical protein
MNKQERKAHARRVLDAELGMTWWNRCTERERARWLERAGSAVPADAWEAFKRETARDVGKEATAPKRP